MDERKIEDLLREYGDGIEPSQRVLLAGAKRKPSCKPIWLAAATAAVALTTFGIVLEPRVALAHTLRQVGTALTDAHTMRVDTTLLRPGGGQNFFRTWYKDGRWRLESRRGTPLELLMIERDGVRYTTMKKFGDTLAEPIGAYEDPAMKEGRLTALDYATGWADMGWVDTPRKTSVAPHAPVDGRLVYEIVMTRSEGAYEARLLIDAKTNLPIRSDIRNTDEHSKWTYRTIEQYTFDEPADDALFVPPTPPIDRVGETARLVAKWSTPISRVASGSQSLEVRDVRRLRDGSIWVVYTSSDVSDAAARDRFWPIALADPSGTTFLQANEIGVDGWSPETNRRESLKIEGKNASIAVFFPLEPAAEWIGAPRLGIGSGEPHASLPEVAPIVTKRWLTLRPTDEDRRFPSYAAVLGLETGYCRFADMDEARARAILYKKRGDWSNAYRWFIAAYKVNLEFVPYRGHLFLTGAAQCLRHLGRGAEAAKLETQAAKIALTDPNAPDPKRDRFWLGD